ncbi:MULTISPECIES: winged helix-turn-helix domain-containing protein [Edwardsiella]|uniref:Winged helix-turn-helix domain-containing protein n=1 Tax=Edwardsiella anguillarum TaxID=1821960 RepID=A0ABY8SG64_9GAMM|nr:MULTISPECIES: winged helix-turn-helix domain-containing protein [Edwardsiella]KAB0587204.1 hypothetical protein F7P84_17765 [Edwardsiella anguillarum]UBU94864.1 winged helix-turn-helix domain-containing protein [Edwardsiella sp. LADL05-105]UOU79926.1 winged helix-turn-helix domain-containing protein [Edwardsiella anguillarum]WHP84674.1 winged helix-turn-helix domain-containing protein [Edwardsiella anguillarum]WHP88457.1 winged helix-turn-helix domain-containing protein [Edwardsiella anguil
MSALIIRGETLYINEEEQALSASEVALLYLLYSNPNVIFGSDDIIKKCWPDRIVSAGSVPVSIKHIRDTLKKITEKQVIITHKGKGYSFDNIAGYISIDMCDINQGAISLASDSKFSVTKIKTLFVIAVGAIFIVGLLDWLSNTFIIVDNDLDVSSGHLEMSKYKKSSNGEVIFHDANGKVIRCNNATCLESSH